MNKCIQTGALLVAVLAMAAPGCKKKEESGEAPPATPKTAIDTPTADDTPEEAPKVDVIAKFSSCWAAWNARDEAAFSACYGEGSKVTQADGSVLEGDAIMADAKNFWAAFPDMKGEASLVLVNGTNVASLVFMSGTNTGPMMMPDGNSMPATGKKHSAYGMVTVDLSDAANIQETDFWDIGLLMGQLTGAEGVRAAGESAGLIEDAPVVASDSDVEKANIAVVEKHLADFTTMDAAGIAAHYSPDALFSYTAAPADMTGTEQITAFFGALKGAFPDIKVESKSMWAAGDYVYLHGEATGKNTGAMPPMIAKATGKDVKLQLGEIYKVKDGKISHHWVVVNGMAMGMQLGLMGEKPAEKK